MPDKIREILLFGSGNEQISFYYERDGRKHFFRKTFEGVIPNLDRRYRESDREDFYDEFGRYMATVPCPSCGGARLKREALHVLIGGMPINKLTALSVRDAAKFMSDLQLDERRAEIGRRVIKEIRNRLGFMEKVGLTYLTLDQIVCHSFGRGIAADQTRHSGRIVARGGVVHT